MGLVLSRGIVKVYVIMVKVNICFGCVVMVELEGESFSCLFLIWWCLCLISGRGDCVCE